MTGSVSAASLAAQDDLAAYAELQEARRALAADIRGDPATLARGLDPAYRLRPHLRVIGDAMADVLAGVDNKLMIFCPPQTGKSTTVAEWGPFWWLVNRPRDAVIITSYGEDLAVRRSKSIREKVTRYGDDFDLAMQPGSSAMQDWYLGNGGHVRAVGVGGGLTGFDANLILVDDPHKDRAEAESPRMREVVHDWWSSTAATRLQPDMGAVVAILTRWHQDDWAGRRLKEEGSKEEGGKWRVIHLPALADPKFGKDPIGRGPGEPLTHPKIPTRDRAGLRRWWEDKRSSSLLRDWYSLYQGDPQPPSGALVNADVLSDIRVLEFRASSPARRVGVAIDPSGGGRDTAGIIAGYYGEDGRMWWTHDRSGVMSSAEWSTAACLLAAEVDADFFVVETNYGGDLCTLAVRTAWERLRDRGDIPSDRLCPLVRTVTAKRNKLLRAEPIAQQIKMDRVRILGRLTDMEREWLTWQPTDKASPGRIDASVYLGYALLPIPSSGASFGIASGQLPASSASPLGDALGGVSSLSPLG